MKSSLHRYAVCSSFASLAYCGSALSITGDTNNDGRVDLYDGTAVAVNFGKPNLSGGATVGDFDNSHTCNSLDLNLYLANYGGRDVGAPAPEQTTFEFYMERTRIYNWQLQSVPIPPAAIAADPLLANAHSYDIYVTSPVAFTAGGLNISLSSGTLYNNLSHGIVRPADGEIAANPAIAYDTFVGAPLQPSSSNSETVLIGRHPAATGNYILTSTQLSVAWMELLEQNTGTIPIARITVLDSVVPPPIPEPSTIAAVLLPSVLLRRRLRKATSSTLVQ